MFDLAHDQNGEVIPGPGTKLACDQAIGIARKIPDAIILLTATVPPASKWKGEAMGRVAQRYISRTAAEIATTFHEAHTLDTIGEIIALTEFVKNTVTEGRSVERVIITVKWWHAPRVRLIIYLLFAWKSIACPVEMRLHWFRVTFRGLLHEMAGLAVNWWQIKKMQ